MKIITSFKKVKEYYENKDHVSQSQLKLLNEGLHKFKSEKEPELYYEEKEYFVIGKAVDIIVTQGRDAFDKFFYISKLEEKPSDTIMSIWHEVYDNYDNFDKSFDSLILNACNNHNYQTNWKDDTRIKKIQESILYFEELIEAKERQIITTEENFLIREYVDKIINGKYTHFFFDDMETAEIDYYFQMPVYFMTNGVQCKALLDMVIVDHINKTMQPIDIKTSSDTARNFYKTMRRYRY